MILTDRYVLVGNHRDAWVYGAIDPSSGTAVMMEMARVMAKLAKDGESLVTSYAGLATLVMVR